MGESAIQKFINKMITEGIPAAHQEILIKHYKGE
jgi:hypothetical protein